MSAKNSSPLSKRKVLAPPKRGTVSIATIRKAVKQAKERRENEDNR